jgi:hypothetical protein
MLNFKGRVSKASVKNFILEKAVQKNITHHIGIRQGQH